MLNLKYLSLAFGAVFDLAHARTASYEGFLARCFALCAGLVLLGVQGGGVDAVEVDLMRAGPGPERRPSSPTCSSSCPCRA